MKPCPIIYENEEILIIHKAAGVAVQGGVGVAHSLDEELSCRLGRRVHLVHRLDKETAGLLVVAKDAAAAAKWSALIASGRVRKEYVAICFGVPVVGGKRLSSGGTATIRAPVEKNGRRQDAVTQVTVRQKWQLDAVVEYDALRGVTQTDGGKRCDGAGRVMTASDADAVSALEFSLLRLVLGTGRMHQLRIHLAGCGAPIVGDDRHGDFKRNRLARRCCGAGRLMLAATRLTVPLGAAMRTFSIPLPAHIAALAATARFGGKRLARQ